MKQKVMSNKQHPIDTLFARKLEDVEGNPSAAAWNRLDARLQQKKTGKKGAKWFSYAAAAIVFFLLGTFWVINSRKTGPDQVAVAVSDGTQQTERIQPLAHLPNETNSTADEKRNLSATAKSGESVHSPVKQPTSTAVVKRELPATPTRTESPVSQESHAPLQEIPVPLPPIEEQMANHTEDTVESVADLPKPDEQTLVVIVQIPVPTDDEKMEEESDPRTKTGKLLEQLKKVKRAEFRELGLTPDNLLARFREKTDK